MRRVNSVSSLLLGLGLLIAPGCNDEGGDDEIGAGSETDSETSAEGVATFGSASDDTSEGESSTADTTSSESESESSESESESSESESSESESSESESSGSESSESDSSASESESSGSESSESESSESESTTTGEEGVPFVAATDPQDLEAGVAPDATISVTFSAAMDAATLTTNTANTSCSGSVQVSADGFSTCVQMAAAPSSGDDTTFTLTPAGDLASATTYELRVLAEVTDAGGTAMAADFTTNEGFTVRYFHSIVIDGVNDFDAGETFSTSTAEHAGYVAWDESYLYLGMRGPALAEDDAQNWFVAYLGGAAGTEAGVTYNTQQPALPFSARWHLRWKASDDYGGALEWSGTDWTDPGFGPIAGSDDVAASGDFVELRVAWSDLEDPGTIALHLGMLREAAFEESCWAAVPEGSHADGYDPDYGQYFEFDRLDSTLPGDYAPG
ncbi:Ig-like domain-containing protein [Pseudenhygromyxa sp. WMMC2535]|uniref:Ig-like domain-containing protein n=1 Tax=Pseudenhygromyxa sp. WMMC2535 TaxID=2712867 RepID=UPI001556E7B8|nr:Ig-like domain-containing protein [Pseudenhygromyxa sp. WMMC2535]NVB42442.1 Ig-like domain-containing protein [Pseudenhygromyxa sp. WMMC2535]